jgi:hypothetical protein
MTLGHRLQVIRSIEQVLRQLSSLDAQELAEYKENLTALEMNQGNPGVSAMCESDLEERVIRETDALVLTRAAGHKNEIFVEDNIRSNKARDFESDGNVVCNSNESDLEDGEIRDTDSLVHSKAFCHTNGKCVDRIVDEYENEDLEEGELFDDDISSPQVNSSADVHDMSLSKSRIKKTFCPLWVLSGSCEDSRCNFAHGYCAEMCPDPNIDDDDDVIAGCVRGACCWYAHSTAELQEMLASREVYRQIKRVKIISKLCPEQLGNKSCACGDACAFAHSTQELIQSLYGTPVYRSVHRDLKAAAGLQTNERRGNFIGLQADERRGTLRSVLCSYWMKGR